MSWLDGFAHRIRTVLRPGAYEQELQQEMGLHEELDTMQQHDASLARRRFGNRTYYLEEARRLTWLGALDVVQQDMRFAWRSLRRNPGVTALIVLTFTLGLGVNAATFTLLDSIYLRSPRVISEPAALHRIWFRMRFEGGPQYVPSMTYPMYRVIRDAWGDSNRVALTTLNTGTSLGGTHDGAKVDIAFTTANYWPILGIQAQVGRVFMADEDRIGSAAPVIVLSDHLWRSRFGHDSGAIGRSVKIDAERYTVIGVAPVDFAGDDPLRPADAWIPLAAYPKLPWLDEPLWQSNGMFMFMAIARSSAGTNLGAFERRATRDVQAFNRALPNRAGDTLMTVATGPILLTRGPGKQAQEHLLSTRLSAVAAIVLLIAAANIVNLLLARAVRRRREIAVRLALGVGRWRLVRMLTAETLLLSGIAAAAALLATWWSGAAMRKLLLPNLHTMPSPLDVRVVAFTIAVALLAGLLAGVVPGIQASTPDLTRSLKEGARDGVAHHSRLRTMLVVTQAALCVVLLAGAALFVESLRNVQRTDLGYDASSVVIGEVEFDAGQSPPNNVAEAQVEQVARQLQGAPGVLGVGRAANVPMWGFSVTSIVVGDDSGRHFDRYPILNPVTAGFFGATGLRLLRGTVFQDQRGAPPQVVVNEAMAREAWPGRNPLGQCIRFGARAATCYTVVGVVQTAKRSEVVEEPTPQYYVPLSNLPASLGRYAGTVLLARASPPFRPELEAQIRYELQRAFPSGYPRVRVLRDIVEPQYRPWRVGATLFTGFGLIALLVAMMGVYSTVSYGVSQRTHEFGVRIALGARIADVLRLVVGEGLRTVALGVVVGVALAIAAGRLIASLLYGVAPSDPAVMIVVSLTLLLVAAFATLLPAWRAGRVDPITALRSE